MQKKGTCIVCLDLPCEDAHVPAAILLLQRSTAAELTCRMHWLLSTLAAKGGCPCRSSGARTMVMKLRCPVGVFPMSAVRQAALK